MAYKIKKSKLKKVEWISGNKMKFESPFKEFNKQTKVLSTGNALHDTQFSWFIRPNKEIECNGAKFEVGHLQNWDLNNFKYLPYDVKEDVMKHTKKQSAILYEFKHHSNGQKVVDGYVLTDKNYKLIKTYYTNDNNKSIGAVDEAKKYIYWQGKK